jgi:hypothetical protein
MALVGDFEKDGEVVTLPEVLYGITNVLKLEDALNSRPLI